MTAAMSNSRCPAQTLIEFIGGPFDGFEKLYPMSAEQLPLDVIWLVSESAFQQLDLNCRSEPARQAKLTSIAVYELNATGPALQYHHAGSISAKWFTDAIRKIGSRDR